MKVKIENSGIGIILPIITIELSRYDLARLVEYGKLSLNEVSKVKGQEYYKQIDIIVK